jgi:hypothetical protein
MGTSRKQKYGQLALSVFLAFTQLSPLGVRAADTVVGGPNDSARNQQVDIQTAARRVNSDAQNTASQVNAADRAENADKKDACDDVSMSDPQKAEYCTAAEQADKAKNGSMIGMGLYGAAGAICAYACAASYQTGGVNPAWGKACSYGSIGAAIADTVVSMTMQQDMAAATQGMMGAGMAAMPLMMGNGKSVAEYGAAKEVLAGREAGAAAHTPAGASAETQAAVAKDWQVPEAQQAVADKATKDDMMSCFTAAMDFLQVGLKAMTMNNAKDTKSQALASANRLSRGGVTAPSLNADAARAPTMTGVAPANNPTVQAIAANRARNSGDCRTQNSVGGTQAVVNCAKGVDPSLKHFADPRFGDAYKKATGQDLGSYLSKLNDSMSPSGVMQAALGPAGQNAGVAAKLKETEGAINAALAKLPSSAGSYASGGGSGGKAKPKADDDMSKMMADMMAAMTGEKKEEDKDPNAILIFGDRVAKMNPATLEQDKSVSLFERVSYRYQTTYRRGDLEKLPWATTYNRELANALGTGPAAIPQGGAAPQTRLPASR